MALPLGLLLQQRVKTMKKIILVLWALICPQLAFAQGPVAVCYLNAQGGCTPAVQANASVKIDTAAAATAQIVALTTGKVIYVTSFNIFAGGTGTIKFVYGTGTNCGTGTTDLTGAYAMKDQAFVSVGNGLGAVLVPPVSNALCITTSATVQMSGSVSYNKF